MREESVFLNLIKPSFSAYDVKEKFATSFIFHSFLFSKKLIKCFAKKKDLVTFNKTHCIIVLEKGLYQQKNSMNSASLSKFSGKLLLLQADKKLQRGPTGP